MRNAHFTAPYMLDPQHPVTVNLIGCGGTGSRVLIELARMDRALRALNHPGLMVYAFDEDHVTSANPGRQMFSESEIGMNKATALITRANRFYQLNWVSHPYMYNEKLWKSQRADPRANIIISCVDTAKARIEIKKTIEARKWGNEPFQDIYYWMDFGNLQYTGQVIMGTIDSNFHKQPKSDKFNPIKKLPDITEVFNLAKIKEDDQGPSCSLAESLDRQDLFINSILAQTGMNILWKMFRFGYTIHSGAFANLETLNIKAIPIK